MTILLPEGVSSEPTEKTNEIQNVQKRPEYQSTEEDEERFFLIYHMGVQPSEADSIDPAYRKWLIARFIAQKGAEQEMMERQRIMRQIAQFLKR